MSIIQAQHDIVRELSALNEDVENAIYYIMAMGKILPEMPGFYKTEENLIKVCNSNVWLAYRAESDKLFFYGESDAVIPRGLLALLLRVFNGQRSSEILTADLSLLHENHLNRFFGTQRSAGLRTMIDRIKSLATASGLAAVPVN